MRGDILASGGRSAQFLPPKISQEKWDKIWETESDIEIYRQDENGEYNKINNKKESKE